MDAIRTAELTPTRIMLSLANAVSKDPGTGKGVALAYALAAHEAINAGSSSSVQIVRDALDIAPQSSVSVSSLQPQVASMLSAPRCAELLQSARAQRDALRLHGSEDFDAQALAFADRVFDQHRNADAAAASMLIARLLRGEGESQFAVEIGRATGLAHQLATVHRPRAKGDSASD